MVRRGQLRDGPARHDEEPGARFGARQGEFDKPGGGGDADVGRHAEGEGGELHGTHQGQVHDGGGGEAGGCGGELPLRHAGSECFGLGGRHEWRVLVDFLGVGAGVQMVVPEASGDGWKRLCGLGIRITELR